MGDSEMLDFSVGLTESSICACSVRVNVLKWEPRPQFEWCKRGNVLKKTCHKFRAHFTLRDCDLDQVKGRSGPRDFDKREVRHCKLILDTGRFSFCFLLGFAHGGAIRQPGQSLHVLRTYWW